jgi:hypothetical protein
MPKSRLCMLFAVAVASLGAATGAHANLLPNSGFDSNLSGWMTVAETTWSSEDSNGGGGSAQIHLDTITSKALAVCVPVTGGVFYEFGVDILLDVKGNNTSAKAGMTIRWRAGDDCAGEDIGFEGNTFATFAPEWTTHNAVAQAPQNADSALVELRASLTSGTGGAEITANLDDPYFDVASGTTTTTTLPGEPSLECGDPAPPYNDVTANDALLVLRASVDLVECDLCLCDLNDSGEVTVLDALVTLRAAVELSATFDCPRC